jgi:hypothetical protein
MPVLCKQTFYKVMNIDLVKTGDLVPRYLAFKQNCYGLQTKIINDLKLLYR